MEKTSIEQVHDSAKSVLPIVRQLEVAYILSPELENAPSLKSADEEFLVSEISYVDHCTPQAWVG